jgi:hypothetical protein
VEAASGKSLEEGRTVYDYKAPKQYNILAQTFLRKADFSSK